MPDTTAKELYHFSEDASIRHFEARVNPNAASAEPLVWAVDDDHAFLYLFPRDCPRVTFSATPETSASDFERFFGLTPARAVAAIESGWLSSMQQTMLYRYVLPGASFEMLDEGAGYWVSRRDVELIRVEPVGDLLAALLEAEVELRVTPSLWLLYEAVIASTLQFSIIRWRNAAPRPNAEAFAGTKELS